MEFVAIDFETANRDASSACALGLAIVKEIAELHGGTVRLENLPGQGAQALLVLPGFRI